MLFFPIPVGFSIPWFRLKLKELATHMAGRLEYQPPPDFESMATGYQQVSIFMRSKPAQTHFTWDPLQPSQSHPALGCIPKAASRERR